MSKPAYKSKEWYAMIGSKGGKKKTTKGFGANRELARKAGRKGGLKKKKGTN